MWHHRSSKLVMCRPRTSKVEVANGSETGHDEGQLGLVGLVRNCICGFYAVVY